MQALSPARPQPTPHAQDESGAAIKPSFQTLQAASQAARVWPVTSPLRAFADEAAQKTGACVRCCCFVWANGRSLTSVS